MPTVVAVDTGARSFGANWTAHLLDALEPSSTWGVVAATQKIEDTLDWADRVGGFDAVALTDTDRTASPASVLAAGVPVGLLDGRPATTARWCALLEDRLTAT